MSILAPHAAAGQALELRQREPIDAPCIEQLRVHEYGHYLHTSSC